MVRARLERIRRMVTVRRSQRRESGNEITVGMDVEEALRCRTLFIVSFACWSSRRRWASFVMYRTGASAIGIRPRAFKRFTTQRRAVKDATVTFITLKATARISANPSRRAENKINRIISVVYP